jgi:hypothetical protein
VEVIRSKYGLDNVSLYCNVNLSGASATTDWTYYAGHFGTINVFNRSMDRADHITSYHPTTNRTWLKVTYDDSYSRYAIEVNEAPVPFDVLENLAKEMTEESGAEFRFHLWDLTSQHILDNFEEIKFLDGTVYNRPRRDDDCDCDCECE